LLVSEGNGEPLMGVSDAFVSPLTNYLKVLFTARTNSLNTGKGVSCIDLGI
jgi:hypothetical protein